MSLRLLVFGFCQLTVSPLLRTVCITLMLALCLLQQHAKAASDSSGSATTSLVSETEPAAPLPGQQRNDISIQEVINLMLQHNPELSSFYREVQALEGTKIQAGKFKNPEFAIEAEDINKQSPSIQRFTTFRISQLIETGGKRTARAHAASIGQEMADRNYEAKRLELIARIANTFTDVLAAQERAHLAEENMRLAQKVVNSTTKRVEAGKAPPIEETKSRVSLSTASIELVQTQRDLASLRKQLSLLWGESSPQFGKALGSLEMPVTLPPLEVLEQRIRNNPTILRSTKNIEQRRALLELEEARRIPDVTLGAGLRRYLFTEETTAVLNFTVPIPVFDRNQGNLIEAHQRINKAIDEQSAINLQFNADLVRSYEALTASQNEITTLRNEVIPGAVSAFNTANKGYELGRFSFLEMLDAQRTLFQSKALYVRALANHQRLVNDIERLIAGPLEGTVMPGAATPQRLQDSHTGQKQEK